jgi:hypothetical protein
MARIEALTAEALDILAVYLNGLDVTCRAHAVDDAAGTVELYDLGPGRAIAEDADGNATLRTYTGEVRVIRRVSFSRGHP